MDILVPMQEGILHPDLYPGSPPVCIPSFTSFRQLILCHAQKPLELVDAWQIRGVIFNTKNHGQSTYHPEINGKYSLEV